MDKMRIRIPLPAVQFTHPVFSIRVLIGSVTDTSDEVPVHYRVQQQQQVKFPVTIEKNPFIIKDHILRAISENSQNRLVLSVIYKYASDNVVYYNASSDVEEYRQAYSVNLPSLYSAGFPPS